jgi:hypothetical protein
MTSTGVETIITGAPQISAEALQAAAGAITDGAPGVPAPVLEGAVSAAVPAVLAVELRRLADLLTGIAQVGQDEADPYAHGHADGFDEAAILLRTRARRLDRA